MYLSNAPGVWIPLSDEELERAGELRNEIADLAQTAPGGERHMDRLTRLSLSIGSAATGAVVAETEGPEAEKKRRANNENPWKEQMRLLAQAMRVAWRRLRRGKGEDREKAKVLALEAHRNSEIESGSAARNNP